MEPQTAHHLISLSLSIYIDPFENSRSSFLPFPLTFELYLSNEQAFGKTLKKN